MKKIAARIAHKIPADLRKALVANQGAMTTWKNITPLARNEWICWINSAKKSETRIRRLNRTRKELGKGNHRPCCWPGCVHR